VGIYSAAIKNRKLNASSYAAMLASTTQLNTPGLRLAELEGVHALTDVTGFGLAGHLFEVCKGSGVAATLRWDQVPLLPGVLDLVKAGIKTGASTRNWNGYGRSVDLGRHGDIEKTLLTDPQTSGGLRVTCTPQSVDRVLDLFRSEGFDRAAVIGEIHAGTPSLKVL